MGMKINSIRSLLLLLVLSSCGKDVEEEVRIRPVVTETVEFYEGNEDFLFSGFSKSEVAAKLSFQVPGLIEEIMVSTGDRLEMGQLVAKLDDTDYTLEHEKSLAELEKVQANLRNATTSYQRFKALYETDSASKNELDEARAKFESATAAVEEARRLVGLALQRLSYTILRSPHNDCFVDSTPAEEGENVQTGETIAEVNCGLTLEVEVAVPETYITKIQTEQKVKVFFNAYSSESFEAYVKNIGVAASSATAFPVTIRLNKQDSRLRPGMAAKVSFTSSEEVRENLIIVPMFAVDQDEKGKFVYVFLADKGETQGAVKQVRVEVGPVMFGGLEIKSGLKPGDKLIIKGVRYLKDGRTVKLLNEG
jgi:multidrug efflux system membrane fusion protein